MFESTKKTVKMIRKQYFEVVLAQDGRGIFHISTHNLVTNKKTSISLIDYGMANFAFESKINLFEGV